MKLSKKTLAAALGVSPAAASRYFARGCPSDSIPAALAWQRANVNPVQRILQHAGRMPAADPAAEVHRLMLAAAADFEAHAEQLRGAMKRVPQHARADMQIDLEVTRRLLPVDLINELGGACDTPDDEADLEHVASILYGLAAGELVWTR